MKKISIFFILAFTFAFAKPMVSVSILPQVYFVKQIAKDLIDINVMVEPGSSPTTYEPKPKQMMALQKSDIYFAIGVPYERVWIKKFKQIYPNLKIIKTQNGIKKMPINAHFHEHSGVVEHIAQTLDPHIWLDPILVKIQAKNIANELIKSYPKHKNIFEKNLQDFLNRLDILHENISKQLKNHKNKTFLVYHPTWGYFASRYGLVQEIIENEGKEPKPKELASIINHAKKDGVKAILVQPQFSLKSAKVIANAIGAKIVKIDSLSPDWENELKKSAEKITKALN